MIDHNEPIDIYPTDLRTPYEIELEFKRYKEILVTCDGKGKAAKEEVFELLMAEIRLRDDQIKELRGGKV